MSSDGDSVTEAADEAISEVVAENDAANASGPSSSWAWLLAGLVAAVFAVVVIKVIESSFQIPLPDEYHALAPDAELGGTLPPEAEEMQTENIRANHARLLGALGVMMALVFGWAGGFIHQRIVGGIIGAVVGVALAIGISMVATPYVVQLSKDAVANFDSGDMLTIGLHALQWAAIVVPAAVAIAIAVANPVSGLKAVGVMLLAAILAGVVYMMGGTMLDPAARLSQAAPQAGNTLYLWACMPPILCGFFLSRTRL